METRVALLAIIVECKKATAELNSLLSEYGDYIFGRMGLPHREKNICVISVAIDAPQEVIAGLSGKIGNIEGVSVKTAYSKIKGNE